MAKKRSTKKTRSKKQAKTKDIGLNEREAPRQHLPEDPPLLDLAQVIGQQRAVEQLTTVIASGRLHHAYLFAGPPGVGKRTTAEALAAMLLDHTLAPDLAGNLAADPTSHARNLAAHRAHPDIHLVNKELAALSRDDRTRKSKQRNIPVGVVQEFLIEPAFRAAAMPAKDGQRARKVFILDEAELMAAGQMEAQNALLKTLEEPPAGTIIVLVTNNEHRLLPTIRSRCLRVPFAPLNDDQMRTWVTRAELSAPPEELAWVLSFADGSPGRAQTAARTGLYAWHKSLTPMLDKLEHNSFDPAMGDTIAKLVDDWAKARVAERPSLSKEAMNQVAIGHMLSLLASRYTPKLRDPHQAEAAAEIIDRIADAEHFAARNVNMKMVFADLAAQIALV
jgi:DNA polymerase-3 subunit delta'